MNSRRFLSLLVPALFFASNAFAATGSGTWPTFAHDFERTNRADGVGAMKSPSVAWSRAMGGTLAANQSLVADVDGDGRANVVTITGGRVVVSQPDGTALWKGALAGARAILGVFPLSGSASDVVIDTPTGVQVLDGKTGTLVESLATGTAATAVFAPEPPKGGILIIATQRGPVSGYDFRNGTNVTAPLWTFIGNNQTDYAVGDLDGDGVPDLVAPLDDGFEVVDPLTALVKYSFSMLADGGPGQLGPPAYFYLYELANVDGKPGDEIVAFDTSYLYSPDTGVYVISVKNNALETLWSSTVTAVNALDADTFSVAGSVADLDGDGKLELVYSRWIATPANDGGPPSGGSWTTYIVDAAGGAVVGTLSDELIQAVADIDGDGKPDVVVRAGVTANQSPGESTLQAYTFTRSGGPVAKSWSLPASHVMFVSSRQSPGPWEAMDVPVAADFSPARPGLELLVGQDTRGLGADSSYAVLEGSDGTIAANVPVAVTVAPTALGWANGLTSATSKNDVVVFTSDGTVHLDSGSLAGAASFSAGSFAYWTYVDGRPSGGNLIFGATSNTHLLWLDGTHLHTNGTPYVLFDESGVTQNPALANVGWPLDPIVQIEGASPKYVSVEQVMTTTSTNASVVAHDPTGVEVWRTPLNEGTSIESPGSYAVDLTGDGVPDILACVVTSSGYESLAVFDGAMGGLVRSTPLSAILDGDELFTGSLVDVNGDHVPDLVAPEHLTGTVAIDLTKDPMSTLWTIPRTGLDDYNGTIGIAELDPVDSGLGPSLFRVNGNIGFGTYQRYSLAGAVLASVSPGLPLAQGFDTNSVALVTRTGTGAFDLVAAGTGDVALSRLERLAGDTLSTVWVEYLANGAITKTAPPHGYALHDPLEMDVDGDGTEDVVVGSDDGYLYAVRSTDGSIVFTVNLGTPVTHVVAANVDTDAPLELVASLYDGRLVAIDDNYAATRDVGTDGGVQDEAGAEAGAGTPIDASAPDSSAPQTDGGVAPAASTSGCGCKTAAGDGGSAWTAAAVAVFALALGRRRRRA